MSRKTETRLARLCVIAGIFFIVLVLLTPGPIIGFGSAPFSFLALVGLGLPLTTAGLLTLIYYHFKKR